MSDKPTKGMLDLFSERAPTAQQLMRESLTMRIANQIATEEDGESILRWLRQERVAFNRKFGEDVNVLFVPEKARVPLTLWVRRQCRYPHPMDVKDDTIRLDGVKIMFVVDLLQPKVGYIHE